MFTLLSSFQHYQLSLLPLHTQVLCHPLQHPRRPPPPNAHYFPHTHPPSLATALTQVYAATPSSTPGPPTWAMGSMIYNWPLPWPNHPQGTADYVIPPDRSRRQAQDNASAAAAAAGADLRQQQQGWGPAAGQQSPGGRGQRWWMWNRSGISPVPGGSSAGRGSGAAAAAHVSVLSGMLWELGVG